MRYFALLTCPKKSVTLIAFYSSRCAALFFEGQQSNTSCASRLANRNEAYARSAMRYPLGYCSGVVTTGSYETQPCSVTALLKQCSSFADLNYVTSCDSFLSLATLQVSIRPINGTPQQLKQQAGAIRLFPPRSCRLFTAFPP